MSLYREYRQVGEEQGGSTKHLGGDLFYFGFTYASTELKIEKQVLVYPLVSFISELGGSLGLFVGFSFLAIWDWTQYLISRGKYVE